MRKKTKLVYGVGINDADYPVQKFQSVNGKQKQIWKCPFYQKWSHMLERCYSPKALIRNKTYLNCRTVPEWHYFMTFRAWMVEQDWEDKQLDKDLLLPGNKLYGPETCLFIDLKVNSFLIESTAARGEWPIGVSYHKRDRKFRASCWDVEENKQKALGNFNSPEEAHEAWLRFKVKQAYLLAAGQSDLRVAAALVDRYENYSKYFDQGT